MGNEGRYGFNFTITSLFNLKTPCIVPFWNPGLKSRSWVTKSCKHVQKQRIHWLNFLYFTSRLWRKNSCMTSQPGDPMYCTILGSWMDGRTDRHRKADLKGRVISCCPLCPRDEQYLSIYIASHQYWLIFGILLYYHCIDGGLKKGLWWHMRGNLKVTEQ